MRKGVCWSRQGCLSSGRSQFTSGQVNIHSSMYQALCTTCQLKGCNHNLKIVTWWKCLELDKTAPRRQVGKSGYIQVYNQGNTRSEHQRSGYQVKEFSIPGMGRCNPLGTLNSFLSHPPQLWGAGGSTPFPYSPCISPSSWAIKGGVGVATSSGLQFGIRIWRSEIAAGFDT